MKRALIPVLVFSLILPVAACRPQEIEMSTETTQDNFDYKYQRYAAMFPEEIVAEMTLEQKAA